MYKICALSLSIGGILSVALVMCVMLWTSPNINLSSVKNIHASIHDDHRKLYFKIGTRQGKYFNVYLVNNSAPECLNPFFPSIHIQASQSHNAWVHIVYTDSKAPEWRTFIDAANVDSPGSAYPFYTYEQDFYDAPLWTYSLLKKPLSFWKGHAFALKVDHHRKTIECIGGIEWGFELPLVKLRPKAIHPKVLGRLEWEQAF